VVLEGNTTNDLFELSVEGFTQTWCVEEVTARLAVPIRGGKLNRDCQDSGLCKSLKPSGATGLLSGFVKSTRQTSNPEQDNPHFASAYGNVI
jgi:hypothetical protein